MTAADRPEPPGTAPAGAVHQFVPMLHRGDAVGHHTLALQRLLVAAGVHSTIWVEHDDPDTADLTRPADGYPAEATPGDVLVYQLATASDLAGWLASRPETLVVNYHNVTPPELMAPWDNALALHQVAARRQVAELAGRAALGVAVSAFNQADLTEAGYGATAVVPPVTDLPSGAPTAPTARPGRPRWLAVGRLAPNKAVEDVLAALACERATTGSDADLVVVGRPSVGAYAAALHRWAAELGLTDAVTFAGALSDDDLDAAYRSADVLVVMSDHEGFCLPVVEAMARGLPVVAYRQGALAEVLGPELAAAGALVDDKDPPTVAAAVRRVTGPAVRGEVVAAGRRRLAELDLASAGPRLVELLLEVRDGAGAGVGPDPAPTA